mgnify:CR=1 FL=1
MEHSPFISILMPVYNAESFLNACLDSIIKQSFTNWELLIVNDYSTDESNSRLMEWCLKDERIQLLQNTTKGIIPALQLAFENSRGKFITRMDADDLMPINKLQRFVKKANLCPNSIITGKVAYFSDEIVSDGYLRYEAWLNSLVDSGDYWKAVYRECVIASPNWMVARTCFEQDFSFSDLTYPEDYDMVLKWYEKGYNVVGIEHVTHQWHEHPARTSRNSDNYQQKAFFKLKTKCFIRLEINPSEKIQLIGAGVKGKLVAKELDAKKIAYDWYDFNAKKKVDVINAVKIQDLSKVKPQLKSILTVWPEDEKMRNAIKKFMNEKNLFFGDNCWLF